MSMKVIKPGLLTTIQDLGRYGYQKYGIIVGGAMDSLALRIANLLVGNSDNDPALEITLTGPSLEWQKDAWIAICGGDLSPSINGEAVPLWRPIYITKNSILTFHTAVRGCRAYLAVAGGIEVPRVMGSGSTYVRAGLGGFKGRGLLEGDVLKFGQRSQQLEASMRNFSLHKKSISFTAASWFVSSDMYPDYESNPLVRIMKGIEFHLFTVESRKALLSETFQVSPQSDRMGCRLSGSRMQLIHPHEMISEAVTAGIVQVPLGGSPIILLADRQTTGGYPRIAQAAAVDLPVIAQVKPGESFRFVEITHQEAEQLYLQRERDIKTLKQGIMHKWRKE